jgi:tetratricopeptide (TPR) repeat protein
VAKSLVAFQASAAETGGRYRLLETVRQYARQRLEASGEAPQIRIRHREWFTALAEAMKLTEPDPRTSLDRLETEYANLRAAMDGCREDPQGAEAGLQLAGALGRFFYLRGYYTEGRRYLEQALGRDAAQAPTAMRARALNGAGVLAGSQSDRMAAQRLMEESLCIYREQEDWSRVAVLTGNLGIIYGSLGKYVDARLLYEDSLQRHRDQGDLLGVARTLNSLGTLASRQGEYALAQTWLSESLKLRRESGDRRGIAVAGNNLGDVALSRGDYPLAHALCSESLQINRELNDRHGMAISLSYLGMLASRQGDYALAQTQYEESLGLFQELDDRAGIANMRNQLGELAEEQGRYAEAHGLYTESLDLYRTLEERRGIALCLDSLASLLLTRAEADSAVRLWGAADALRDALGVPRPPLVHEKYERQQAQARRLLEDETFAACWAEGRRLPWEQAVAFVTGAGSEENTSS